MRVSQVDGVLELILAGSDACLNLAELVQSGLNGSDGGQSVASGAGSAAGRGDRLGAGSRECLCRRVGGGRKAIGALERDPGSRRIHYCIDTDRRGLRVDGSDGASHGLQSG